MTIGQMIRDKRKEKHMSQLELGKKLGVTSQMIAQYENDKRKPKLETLKKICQAMDITIGQLGDNIWKCYSAEEFAEDFKNIKITFSSKMPESMGEHYKNLLVAAYDNLSDNGKSDAYKLLEAYSGLNVTGQYEAIKRIQELSQIEGYRKGDPEPEPDKPRIN